MCSLASETRTVRVQGQLAMIKWMSFFQEKWLRLMSDVTVLRRKDNLISPSEIIKAVFPSFLISIKKLVNNKTCSRVLQAMPQTNPTVCFSLAVQIPASIYNSIDAHLKHDPVKFNNIIEFKYFTHLHLYTRLLVMEEWLCDYFYFSVCLF